MGDLAEAEEAMKLAYIDWQDNTASEDFREEFYIARDWYRECLEKEDK